MSLPSMSSAGSTGGELFDFLMVSNRLPIEPGPAGSPAQWRASPGGLVSALQPVITKNGGAWVGWTGEPAGTVDDVGPVPREPGRWWEDTGQVSVVPQPAVPVQEEPATVTEDVVAPGNGGPYAIPVCLSAAEIACYYEGFCNATIWPLYHDVIAPPVYSRRWWHCYVEVNRRFANTVAAHSAQGATVWLHDYHLQLCPELLRELRPDLRIGFFNHIPFPPYELFAQLPWRKEVIEGLLGADLIGFQTADGADNFLRACRRLTGHHTQGSLVQVKVDGELGGRTARAAAFPISVDADELSSLAQRPEVLQRAREIREEVGNPERLFLGVDRLDYTKGILHRLRAYGELLKEGKVHPPEAVLVQIASPSRGEVEQYQRLRDEVERAVGSMNGDFSPVGHPAVHYLHQSFPKEEMVAFYLAADVALVTPLRDGMNLVAKEYVACRYDGGGRLVLSELTGAANELTDAFLVNPHDIDSLKAKIIAAVRAPEREATRRMRRMRRRVFDHDVHRWAAEFLGALDGGQRLPMQLAQEDLSQMGSGPAETVPVG